MSWDRTVNHHLGPDTCRSAYPVGLPGGLPGGRSAEFAPYRIKGAGFAGAGLRAAPPAPSSADDGVDTPNSAVKLGTNPTPQPDFGHPVSRSVRMDGSGHDAGPPGM